MTWDAVEQRAQQEDGLESGVVPPPATPLVVTDDFNLFMVECPTIGCVLSVKQVSRLEASDLANRYQAPIVSVSEKNVAQIERELGMSGPSRPRLGRGTRLLLFLRNPAEWKDARWFIVEFVREGTS